MSEKYLHRKDAPFGSEIWEKIDQTVVAAAKSQLCGRRILHVDGPYGLGLKALPSEDKQVSDEKATAEVSMYASCPAPVMTIQSKFNLSARDIVAFEQTGVPLELGQAAKAAISCARQEDSLIFNGSTPLKLDGLFTSDRAHVCKLKSWDQTGTAADDIIGAATLLDEAGFAGPYVLALTPKLYNLLLRRYPQAETTELEHIRQIATEGIIKAPAISNGGIFLNVGRQFVSIVLGQDLTTVFVGPCEAGYEFNIIETLALRLVCPGAICILQQ